MLTYIRLTDYKSSDDKEQELFCYQRGFLKYVYFKKLERGNEGKGVSR